MSVHIIKKAAFYIIAAN